MLTISPTRIRIFRDCPQRYALTYVRRAPPAAPSEGPQLAFGSSLHLALKQYHGLVAARSLPPERLLRQCWVGGGYADPSQEAEYFAEGVAILRQYRESVRADIPCNREVTLSQVVYLAWQPVKLVGRVDREQIGRRTVSRLIEMSSRPWRMNFSSRM